MAFLNTKKRRHYVNEEDEKIVKAQPAGLFTPNQHNNNPTF
jgi:hypothetical protein